MLDRGSRYLQSAALALGVSSTASLGGCQLLVKGPPISRSISSIAKRRPIPSTRSTLTH
jgi:hypothetical protein